MSSEPKKEDSIMDIVKEYGTVPLVGLGSAILVSKELFMVNEEVVVLGCFSTVVFYLYVTLYDPITETFMSYRDGIKKEQVEGREKKLAVVEELADHHRQYTRVSEEIKAMYDHIEKTQIAHAEAINRATEASVVNSLESELQDLYDTQVYVNANIENRIMTNAAAGLNKYLETVPQKEKDAYFTWALGALEGKGTVDKEDFVTTQFKKEIAAQVDRVNKFDEKAAMAKIAAAEKSGEIDLSGPGLIVARKLMGS